MTKTCGECKHYYDYVDRRAPCCWSKPTDNACYAFELKDITNGDKIIQQGNNGLAAFACGLLNDRSEEAFQRVLSFLNAPAESEGEDE